MRYDIKETAREAMRVELANAALDLMVEHGYEQTANELADALGISRATFFRHLGSKEEIFTAVMIGPVDLFAASYAAASTGKVRSWQVVRAAFDTVTAATESAPDRMRSRYRLIRSIPSLGGRLRRARFPQIEQLAAALTADGYEVFQASIVATAAVAVFDQCWALWAADEGASLSEIVDRAFAELTLI